MNFKISNSVTSTPYEGKSVPRYDDTDGNGEPNPDNTPYGFTEIYEQPIIAFFGNNCPAGDTIDACSVCTDMNE